VPSDADRDEDWFGALAEAQEILSAWETQVGRFLPTNEAVALMDGIARALQRSFERGKAWSNHE
jgi:hypothetical protein